MRLELPGTRPLPAAGCGPARRSALVRRLAGWLTLLLLCGPAVAAPAPPAATTLLVLGDSLSAEYGLPRGAGWVALLAQRLSREAPQYSVVNASISGDTTSGGRARLDELLLRHRPAIVVIELGANDGLRGLRIDAMRDNLQAMIERCRAVGARVLLVGMHLPPNYGPEFDARFHAVYLDLARRDRVALVPFLLEGFAEHLENFQADHVHPLAQAEPRMLENVWPALRPLLVRR